MCAHKHDPKRFRIVKKDAQVIKQGQLNVCDYEWLDFVVRRSNPHELHIERIYRDRALWNTIMEQKLTMFYKKFILPELALPRYHIFSGIRRPQSPWYDPTAVKRQAFPGTTVGGGSQLSSIPQSNPCDPETTVQFDTISGTNVQVTQSEETAWAQPSTSTANTHVLSGRRSIRRNVCTKFVERRIRHKCGKDAKKTQWFNGTVLEVLKGRDGASTAVYEVQYDNKNVPCEIENLHADFTDGSVYFIDI